MADEEKKGDEETTEDGGGKGGLVTIVLLVLVLANLGLTAFMMLSGPGGGDAEVSEEPGPILPLEPFVINLDEPGADRYLRLTIALEIDEEDTGELVTTRTPILRDSFLAHLSSQQVETLKTKESKERLREELAVLARDVVSDTAIRNVYFTEFIIQ